MINRWVSGLAVVTVGLILAAVFLLPASPSRRYEAIVEEQLIIGHVEVEKNGVLLGETSNIVVNGGKELVEQLLCTTNASIVQYIAVATDMPSPDPTWTTIPNEVKTGGLERAAGTISDLGTGNWRVEITYTATADFTNVNGTGIYWASTGNYLFACAGITSVNLVSGDQLTVRWDFTIS